MTQNSTSYVRRFVRTGMTLLIVQLIAALVTIGLTGWAAFYVADLRAERDQLRAELEAVRDAPNGASPIYVDEPIQEIEPLEDPVNPLEPEPQRDPSTPTPTSPPVRERPVTTRPPVRIVPTPRTPVTQTRPTPRPPTTATPRTPSQPEQTAPPPRRNTVYPGGLPGDGPDNSVPPRIRDRIVDGVRSWLPTRDRNPVPGGTSFDPRGIAEQGGRLEPDPPRDQQRQPDQPPQTAPRDSVRTPKSPQF